MKTCDLHTHSVFSDGTFTPTEIICAAENMGLSAVALCDHNTVDGLPEFLKAAEGRKIKAVCGCELSVTFEEKQLLTVFLRATSSAPKKSYPIDTTFFIQTAGLVYH